MQLLRISNTVGILTALPQQDADEVRCEGLSRQLVRKRGMPLRHEKCENCRRRVAV